MGFEAGVGSEADDHWSLEPACEFRGHHTQLLTRGCGRVKPLINQNSCALSQVFGSNCESGKRLPIPVRREGVPCCPFPFVIAPCGRVNVVGTVKVLCRDWLSVLA